MSILGCLLLLLLFLLLFLLKIIIYFFPHSLATSSFLQLHMLLTWTTPLANNRCLSDQHCVQSLGYKYLVLLWSVCVQCLGSPQQKCGELDHGLQFLYVMWCKGNKNPTQQPRIFKMRKRRIPPTFLPNIMFHHLFQLVLVLFLKPHKEANILFHIVSYMVFQSGKGKVKLRELEKWKESGEGEEQEFKKQRRFKKT